MDRQEFIAELRRAMSGSFSAAEIADTAAYYEEYITMQIKKGKQEDEVLRELGSPRLIAKSMKAAGGSTGGIHGGAGAQSSVHGSAGGRSGRRSADDDPVYDEDAECNGRMHTFRLPMWLVLLIVLLVLLAILMIVLRLLFALLPIILVVVGIVTLYRYFSKK